MDTDSHIIIKVSVPNRGFSSNSARAAALSQVIRRYYNLSVEEWLVCQFDAGLQICGTVRENDNIACAVEVEGDKAISHTSIRPGECVIATLQKQDTSTLRLQPKNG